jgi:Ca2+/H+ antiporter
MALVHQGQRSIVAGGILGVALLAGVGLAIAAIVGGIQVRSKRDNDAAARTRAAIAICLAAISLVLMTLAGLELYAIGLDAF